MKRSPTAALGTYRIRLPSLHPAQVQMVAESRRYNVAACGRRFGKTFLALDVLIDGPRHKGALHGFPVALYAPTYQTMLESWRKLVHVLKPITLKNPTAITAWTCSPAELLNVGVWTIQTLDAGANTLPWSLMRRR